MDAKDRNKAPRSSLDNDVGFGTRITQSTQRFINKDGSFNIIRSGKKETSHYEYMVEMSWRRFFVVVTLFYIIVNAIFAVLHVIIGVEHLSGVQSSSFLEDFLHAFFFSVQTFTTVGYGAISPQGAGANILATLCALVGLMSFALATGLFFARFSKPVSHILYSKNALISPYQNGKALVFRIVNIRDNRIINLEATFVMTWIDTDENGEQHRRYKQLQIERDQIVFLPLNWTIVHPINEESPLFGKTQNLVNDLKAEFLVMIKGFDETFNQVIFSNSSYTCNELVWDAKFDMMYENDDKKGMVLHLEDIDNYTKLDT